MTLNLQIVLAIMGVIVVSMIYLISRWQNRMRRPSREAARSERYPENRDSGNDGPALGRYGTPEDRVEMPVPGTPVHTGWAGRELAGDGGGVAEDSNPGEEATAAARAGDDFIADDGSEAPRPADDKTINPDRYWPAEQTDDARTPVFGAAAGPVSEKEAAEFSRRPAEGFERLSQIDYWGKITGERDVGRETVLAIYRDGATGFSKARGVYGFKTAEKGWCDLEGETEGSRFTDIVMTIQLADRNGAISEREMTRFSALVSRLSEGTGREFVFMAAVESAFVQADAIAEFARHFDSVFAVNIRPQGAESFHGPTIDRCALQMGLERDDNHYYSRFKPAGKGVVALYSLADLSDTGRFDFDDMKSFSTRGLTFFTRPAVNRSPGAVFAEMVDTAKAFASRIKGEANAPNHNDLSQEEVEATRRSIERVAAEMERLGIPAGSDEAARIF